MNSMFRYDGYLNRILTKIMYIVALNFLFILCSLPIVTLGASCTAMYTVLFRFVRNDEPDILKTFFRAFRENLKKSSCIWAAMLALASTLALNYYVLYHMQGAWTDAVRVVLNLILVLWAILWVYVFPAAAYYQNTVLGYVQFSLRAAVANLPITAAVLVLQIGSLILMLFLSACVPAAVLLLICCCASLPAYFSAQLLGKIFEHYEETDCNSSGISKENMV